jgi:hypothetical protein
MDGGVKEPVEGAVPWLRAPSLDSSVDFSVRKLALDLRRKSLNLRNDGAIADQRLAACGESSEQKMAVGDAD